jgi:hypothetical protein
MKGNRQEYSGLRVEIASSQFTLTVLCPAQQGHER